MNKMIQIHCYYPINKSLVFICIMVQIAIVVIHCNSLFSSRNYLFIYYNGILYWQYLLYIWAFFYSNFSCYSQYKMQNMLHLYIILKFRKKLFWFISSGIFLSSIYNCKIKIDNRIFANTVLRKNNCKEASASSYRLSLLLVL